MRPDVEYELRYLLNPTLTNERKEKGFLSNIISVICGRCVVFYTAGAWPVWTVRPVCGLY